MQRHTFSQQDWSISNCVLTEEENQQHFVRMAMKRRVVQYFPPSILDHHFLNELGLKQMVIHWICIRKDRQSQQIKRSFTPWECDLTTRMMFVPTLHMREYWCIYFYTDLYSTTEGLPLRKHMTPTFSAGLVFKTTLLLTSTFCKAEKPIKVGSPTLTRTLSTP